MLRLPLHAKAPDGTWIGIQTSNVADNGYESTAPTRPTPLAGSHLVRIAELPGLHW